ncbi:unnamed protein product [Paramecium primaurelia]|uniref:Uncharacterized protein n=1 Tax=Paramecium primaurelia TaxID=5886 RepID=A0A8S1K0Z2_PARPR|nr:unnamed protein product [Paramecium primaurelia]
MLTSGDFVIKKLSSMRYRNINVNRINKCCVNSIQRSNKLNCNNYYFWFFFELYYSKFTIRILLNLFLTPNFYTDKTLVTVIELSITQIVLPQQMVNFWLQMELDLMLIKLHVLKLKQQFVLNQNQFPVQKLNVEWQMIRNICSCNIIQQLSENDSAIPYTATYTLIINPSSCSLTFAAISCATYDSTQPSYLATSGNFALVFRGVIYSGASIVVTLENMIHKITRTCFSIIKQSLTATFSNLPV